ncbi:PREDICTED: semaphorin-4F [Myotis davidii]|uniref:semaphorin-4F n=1 Tax=Myotis davidii TaxID=225400 RepID=UPI0007675FB1|nr:PREDICTED: semaphorin-4F [Myotis davidii]
MAEGVLYAATVRNYLGTEPIISRAVGRAEDWIRTETLPSWLNAPAFVAAMALRPAEWGDEDGDKEIYFFFTETSQAFDSDEHLKVPRVARVCAGDLGGRRTLQQRWTTFLKADLLCPGPVDGRASSVLQDMSILRPETGVGAPIFYGIFSSQWEGAAISAVCAFRPQDIRTVLNGPFRELKHDCNRGLPVMDNEVPQPRPGECIANNMKLQQFGSSLSLPDRVLTFIRDHPLMDRPVLPADGHTLLVTLYPHYLLCLCCFSAEHPVVFEVLVATAVHVVLPCSPSSAWASCVWHQPSGVTAFTPRRDGLEVVVNPGAMGAYACECQEGGAARVVAAYSLVWGSHQGPSSRAHTVGAGLAGFFLGVLAASLTLLLIGRRQQRRRQRELLARDKVGLDLGAPPSGTTSYSQDPPSPSPEDERLPLALGKRGSGFGGFPPPFLLDPCSSPAHIRLTGAPLATCDETSI